MNDKNNQINMSDELKSKLTELEQSYDLTVLDLKRLYEKIMNVFRDMYSENQHLSNALKKQKLEYENISKKLSAYNLLDGLGSAFANLYNTIYDIPNSISIKKNLIYCINQMNDELANFGITILFDHNMSNENYKCLRVCSTSDEIKKGKKIIIKAGFLIENEKPIKAEYYEYSNDKSTQSTLEKNKFIQNIDFKFLITSFDAERQNKIIIKLLSDKMKHEFENIINNDGDIYLGELYPIKNTKDLSQTEGRKSKWVAFFIDHQNLYCGKFKKCRFGKEKSKLIDRGESIAEIII